MLASRVMKSLSQTMWIPDNKHDTSTAQVRRPERTPGEERNTLGAGNSYVNIPVPAVSRFEPLQQSYIEHAEAQVSQLRYVLNDMCNTM
jgi:hypothetical protein